MSTIIVYKPATAGTLDLSPASRRAGMKDAGLLLRNNLSASGGSANDVDAEDRVRDALDQLAGARDFAGRPIYDIRFEESRIANLKYKITGEIDQRGRYKLVDPTNLDANGQPLAVQPQPALNRKLRLDVSLDDFGAKTFRMRVTVPKAASDAQSWSYLSDEIDADLVQVRLEPTPVTNIQNYLISTFSFSRCR